jgi:choice-of-anchor B domain-containing protein
MHGRGSELSAVTACLDTHLPRPAISNVKSLPAMRNLLIPLFCMLAATAVAQPVTSYHTTLFDHIDPGPPADHDRYSALTGYVAPDGREYAILGGWEGTYIVDVTSRPIRVVTFIPGSPSPWREMKTYSHYAYVVTEGTSPYVGMQIIDLAKLPESAELVALDSSCFLAAHTITQEGGYLFANGTSPISLANGGVIIMNIADDPVHPKNVGTYQLRYIHDCTVRNDTLYAAAINYGELDIVYLGPKRDSARFITDIRYPNAATHNCDLTPDGSYVLTTDEIPYGTTLKSWDIRDLNNISKVADYTPVPGAIVHNVHIRGSIAYVSWYTAGSRIIDVSDPRDPAQLGYYDTYTRPDTGFGFDGNWEIYPYLPSGKILASDMLSGLNVFTFDGVSKGKISGTVSDATTGAPIAGATITVPKIGLTITADAQGRYAYSGAADTLAVAVGADAYRTLVDEIILTPSGNQRNFRLTSLPSGVAGDVAGAGAAEISVAPNPMERAGVMTLRSPRAHRRLRAELLDELGRTVSVLADGARSAGEYRIAMDVAGLPAGCYFWRVTGDDGPIASGAVVVAR